MFGGIEEFDVDDDDISELITFCGRGGGGSGGGGGGCSCNCNCSVGFTLVLLTITSVCSLFLLATNL